MPPMPWALLAAACLGMFAASSSGTTRAPFLIDMSRDLSVSLAMVANLMAATSIAWGVASVVAGAASDRWGRRPLMIGGPIGLAAGLVWLSLAGSFVEVALAATAAGACAGAFTGVIMAEASARTVDRQRGRALGWVMAGQSFALLVGVPVAAWIGTSIGWRGVNQVVAGVALLAALGLFATTLRPAQGAAAAAKQVSMRGAMTGPVMRLLWMGVAERVCYGLTVVYYATFLQTIYGLTPAGVAIPLGIMALGNILGTILGGQAADRLADRLRTFALTMVASGSAALILFGWTPGLWETTALGFAYATFGAMSRPSLMAALANVPDEVRGTVLGLNVTAASLGWLGAASIGGWIMAEIGFGAFGPFALAVALVAAMLALTGRRQVL
ncbi:MFS transporter [Roseomonas terrae]|jgi:DHA1 family inner membrane transport protein|uniref:MFS transporter n=1 Tax=Neoroseomonas terrae TaxID=424799 RepID=A0ABS5EPK9_9PROT|nr:MFS transporter [Neoroseomonas terrae]MBR0652895.1 MFS transporter [Neoroseomonas terrae]